MCTRMVCSTQTPSHSTPSFEDSREVWLAPLDQILQIDLAVHVIRLPRGEHPFSREQIVRWKHPIPWEVQFSCDSFVSAHSISVPLWCAFLHFCPKCARGASDI